MKKALSIMLALAMTFALASCGGDTSTDNSNIGSSGGSQSAQAPEGLVYVSGSSWREAGKDGDTTLYTYNALVNGQVIEITGSAKKFDGLYNEVTTDEKGVYTKMELTDTQYEIVVGDFTGAVDGVVTLGGKELTCAAGLTPYLVDLEGGISTASLEEDYTGTESYTVKVMYTTNEAGEIDNLFIKQNATRNYTTQEELLSAAEKAGMSSAVLTDTFGNRANVKYMVKDDSGSWSVVFDVTSDSWCGRSGTSDNKKEGDGASPTGMYPVFLHFGTLPSPAVKEGVSYTQLKEYQHFWADGQVEGGTYADLYNKFLLTEPGKDSVPDTIYGKYDYVVLEGVNWTTDDEVKSQREGLGFSSCEWLYEETTAYAYSSSIEYNTNWVLGDDGKVTYQEGSVVDGNGSCIFFHCQSGGATSGCISIPEADYKTFLETVDAYGAMIAIN